MSDLNNRLDDIDRTINRIHPQEQTEFTLDELLEGLTPELVHGEMDWGSSVGEEEW